jgi:hypothetical protein
MCAVVDPSAGWFRGKPLSFDLAGDVDIESLGKEQYLREYVRKLGAEPCIELVSGESFISRLPRPSEVRLGQLSHFFVELHHEPIVGAGDVVPLGVARRIWRRCRSITWERRPALSHR